MNNIDEKPPYDFEKDKLRLWFKDPKEIFNYFHIDFNKGIIYNKKLWDKGIQRECGRPIGKGYQRISVTKNGRSIDFLSHRLIFYAFHGYLSEKIDHAEKNIQYPNAISNLRRSDSIHNRANTKKIKRRKLPAEQKLDKRNRKDQVSDKYIGVYNSYGFYWAKYKNKIINEKGFISEILAVNFRNEFVIKEYEKTYQDQGIFDFPPYPESGLDFIDSNELFLDQMIQEAVEKTEEYQKEQARIKATKEKVAKSIKETNLKKQKLKVSTFYPKQEEHDPFECIGKYE